MLRSPPSNGVVTGARNEDETRIPSDRVALGKGSRQSEGNGDVTLIEVGGKRRNEVFLGEPFECRVRQLDVLRVITVGRWEGEAGDATRTA
jgi:hypothetical protein